MSILRGWRTPLYSRNVAILKSYGGHMYKLTRNSCLRNKGVIAPEGNFHAKGTVNTEKLSNNISRARSRVQEYGYCNPWKWFCTFTINPAKFNRYMLKAFFKVFSQFIQNYSKKHGTRIRYLLIPEQHKDGAWHLHGLFSGLPTEHLTPFTLCEHLPNYIRYKLENGQPVFNWLPYMEKFGWVDIEPVRDQKRAANYILKYITKDLERSVSEVGAHMYYCSKGLNKAQEIKRGFAVDGIAPDFENDYCKVNWFDGSSTSEEDMKSLIISPNDQQKGCSTHDTTSSSNRVPNRPADSRKQPKHGQILSHGAGLLSLICRDKQRYRRYYVEQP